MLTAPWLIRPLLALPLMLLPLLLPAYRVLLPRVHLSRKVPVAASKRGGLAARFLQVNSPPRREIGFFRFRRPRCQAATAEIASLPRAVDRLSLALFPGSGVFHIFFAHSEDALAPLG